MVEETLEAVRPVCLNGVLVDGRSITELAPSRQYSEGVVTSREIANEIGMDNPPYRGMHQHCQYQRRC